MSASNLGTPTSPLGDPSFDRIHKALRSTETGDRIANAIGMQIWITDLAGNIVRVNQPWLDSHGFRSMDDVLGRTAHEVFGPVQAAQSIAEGLEVVDTGETSVVVTADENGRKFQTMRMPLTESGELVGVMGITAALEPEIADGATMVTAAEVDPLTGASSVGALHQFVAETLASGEDMTLLLIDLDDFHVVNTAMGRESGDQLLQKAAKRLINVFGSRLYRVGGDAFVVMLPTIQKDQLTVVSDQILQRWRQPLIVDGTEVYGGVSIGLAPITNQASPEEVLQDAEMALRESKSTGRNRATVFQPSQRKQADEELWNQMLIRRAVAEKEFVLHWQPIFNINTGAIVGVESLLRWQPRGGEQTLPAAEFIPFLDHSGLIIPVGLQVIEDACRQQAAWRSMDKIARAIPIHVNVSRRQFWGGTFVDSVLTTLQKFSVEPSTFTVEIADFSPGQGYDDFLDDLGRLRKAGVNIAIDDFGHGWSALGQIRGLPVSSMKVARTITDTIEVGADNLVLGAIQTLAEPISNALIIQGVENDEQLSWLRHRGWSFAQGYHLSKPLDQSSTTQLLSNNLAHARAA